MRSLEMQEGQRASAEKRRSETYRSPFNLTLGEKNARRKRIKTRVGKV